MISLERPVSRRIKELAVSTDVIQAEAYALPHIMIDHSCEKAIESIRCRKHLSTYL